jgi:hypothetical protein
MILSLQRFWDGLVTAGLCVGVTFLLLWLFAHEIYYSRRHGETEFEEKFNNLMEF